MKKLHQQIARLAVKASPDEVCGVIKNSKAIRCENKASETSQAFLIDAETYLKYLPDTIFHSHPTGASGFSEHDLAVAANMELTSYVYVVEADRLEKWTAEKGVEVFEKVLDR
jgi:proteasome lid subunit RPN8/RPN11